jgi:Flp pilus assembly protein TadB
MSLPKELREEANREPDPEIRRQRLAKIDEIESGVLDFDKRHAAVKADLADLQSGRKRFFSWIEFTFGLGVVAVLVGSFYFELSSGATIVVVGVVVLSVAGIRFLRIKRRLKKLDKSA